MLENVRIFELVRVRQVSLAGNGVPVFVLWLWLPSEAEREVG
jgi:hypothetical protein